MNYYTVFRYLFNRILWIYLIPHILHFQPLSVLCWDWLVHWFCHILQPFTQCLPLSCLFELFNQTTSNWAHESQRDIVDSSRKNKKQWWLYSGTCFFFTFWVVHCCCNTVDIVFGACPDVWTRPGDDTPLCKFRVSVEAGSWTGCVMVGTLTSCLTPASRTGEVELSEQFEGVTISSLTWSKAGHAKGGGESPCWLLFSTSNCIFNSSTSLCSCSNFRISSSIWRSFSWRRLSFSDTSVGPSWLSAGILSLMPRLDTLVAISDTGGLCFTLSQSTSTRTEFSWYDLSLSIRSVFVPETGKDLSFSSIFSSATWQENNYQFKMHIQAWTYCFGLRK